VSQQALMLWVCPGARSRTGFEYALRHRRREVRECAAALAEVGIIIEGDRVRLVEQKPDSVEQKPDSVEQKPGSVEQKPGASSKSLGEADT